MRADEKEEGKIASLKNEVRLLSKLNIFAIYERNKFNNKQSP